MTATVATKTLYERDLNLWLLENITYLQEENFDKIDIEHLIEELKGLAGRDRRELESRLVVLLSHLLKRLYVASPYDFRGWQNTIREQRRQLKLLLKQSPSLGKYLVEVFPEAWQDALSEVREDYPQVQFPERWEFSRDVEALLSEQFWNSSI